MAERVRLTFNRSHSLTQCASIWTKGGEGGKKFCFYSLRRAGWALVTFSTSWECDTSPHPALKIRFPESVLGIRSPFCPRNPISLLSTSWPMLTSRYTPHKWLVAMPGALSAAPRVRSLPSSFPRGRPDRAHAFLPLSNGRTRRKILQST